MAFNDSNSIFLGKGLPGIFTGNGKPQLLLPGRAGFMKTSAETQKQILRGPDQHLKNDSELKDFRESNQKIAEVDNQTLQNTSLSQQLANLRFLAARTNDPQRSAALENQMNELNSQISGNYMFINFLA